MTGRTVQVILPEELDAAVTAAVEAGEYASASHAITDAVAAWSASRQLDSSLDREELRRLWLEGLESGPGRNMSIEEIKEEARRGFVRK